MGMLSDCLPRPIVKGLCQRYLKTSIWEEQCQESGRLVETTVGQIEAVQFLSHCGICFIERAVPRCPWGVRAVGRLLGVREIHTSCKTQMPQCLLHRR